MSITARDYAEAEYLESHLLETDKRVILRIQRYAEMLHKYPKHEFIESRLEVSVSLLAKRLKVSQSVANALACFEVAR